MVLIMSASPLVPSSLLGNNLGLMATPWWFMAGTICCPILAIQLRSLSELMVLIMSASPLVDGDALVVVGQNNVSFHTRNSAEIPLGAHGADYVCESTGILLTAEKEFEVEGDALVVDGQNNVLSHTRSSAEIPFEAHGADYVCESMGIFLTTE